MVWPDTEDKVINHIIKKYKIPLTKRNFGALFTIQYWLDLNEVEFETLINYLKDRSTRDCYNHPINENTRPETIYDWIVYLHEYAYYVENILKDGINRWDRKKPEYMFPDDIYDITYHYRYNRKSIFLKYMGILKGD